MFTHWNDCVVTWFSIIKCTIYSMSPYLQSFVWIRAALIVIKSDDLVYILVQQKYVTLPHFNFVAIVWLLMLNRCTTLKSPHAEWLNASPPCFGNDSAEYRSVMTGRLSWRQCNTLHLFIFIVYFRGTFNASREVNSQTAAFWQKILKQKSL